MKFHVQPRLVSMIASASQDESEYNDEMSADQSINQSATAVVPTVCVESVEEQETEYDDDFVN